MSDFYKDIIEFRRELHQNPELSEKEFETQERVLNQMKKYNPDQIINFKTETGIAFVFDSKTKGETVVFRCELDALPIVEENNIEHKSQNKGVAHLCGHDGHMSIIMALGKLISQNRPEKGKVVLLFQPAEEEKQGAEKIVEDENFKKLNPDYIFALHNIPGIKKNTILFKKQEFAAASMGMIIRLFGKTSHAGHPENGISPANAISDIIKDFNEIENNKDLYQSYALKTFIHIKMGEIAFGTAPGYAEVMVTLRAYKNQDINIMKSEMEKKLNQICDKEKLKFEVEYNEVFPATVNKEKASNVLLTSIKDLNFVSLQNMSEPFSWSEDFGYYSNKYNTAFFGYGSGVSQPQLHNPDFDFPDDIIEGAAKTFFQLYKQILK